MEIVLEKKEEIKADFRNRRQRRRKRRIVLRCILLLLLFSFVTLCAWELRTSWLQARCLTAYASRMTFWVEPGPSPSIYFPQSGPYDLRMGYSNLHKSMDKLTTNGYKVAAQARFSPRLLKLANRGIFPPYREKAQGGLTILDSDNQVIFSAKYPERVYKSLDTVPGLIVKTLLFIENRELLDQRYPYRNPAVEWDRFARAILDMGIHAVFKSHKAVGGSTMATQLEKYKHSPEGRTSDRSEKIQQMTSAALRTYINGKETLEWRRQIVLDYINSVPLAAIPGYGEVNGLGDGLWAWYGTDFDEINRYLADNAVIQSSEDALKYALAYKQVLSLFLAHRRPSFYMVENQNALRALTDRYIVLLSKAGVISSALRNATLRVTLAPHSTAPPQPEVPFLERKAANAIRTYLREVTGVPYLYDLDRYDLTVKSTIDNSTQQEIMKILQKLSDPEYARAVGVVGPRLLGQDRVSDVIYSFTFYEHVNNANVLRVQADSFDQPLNINEGIKLELGSTAKLRTLVSYLEIIAALHERYSGLSREELKNINIPDPDRLSRWAIAYLSTASDKSLKAMLDAAMQRRYSGSPAEKFFTGGGLHSFVNFESKENGQLATVKEALQESINLSFIRIMRDIVSYYTYQVPGSTASLLKDIDNPKRQEYLMRFADKEGRVFINRFYRKYKDKSSQEMIDALIQGIRPTLPRLAVIFRSIKPEASVQEFAAFMRESYNDLSDENINELYEKYSKPSFNLADRGYIAHIHPLELWTVEYLLHHPDTSYNVVAKDSADERQAVYSWLFSTSRKHAQDMRIRTLIEVEAFQEIHHSWKRLGYPFESLVPSLATAIGVSADRPAALAELVGIIQNNGVRYPNVRMEDLHFAKGTPYETILKIDGKEGEQVIKPEIAAIVKDAMINVVEKGTARRLYKALMKPDKTFIPIGGKTGTGDNRRDIYGARGKLIESKVMSRTATFVFLIGDRFFGTITAYVAGPEAARYKFTSTLPVQLTKILAPKLVPLMERSKKAAPVPSVADTNKPMDIPKVQPDAGLKIKENIQPPALSKPLIPEKPAPKPPVDQPIEEKTYTVKIGTFSSRENAENLVNSVKSAGFQPRMVAEQVDGKNIYHVLVGSYDNIDKADQIGRSLKEKSPGVTNYMIKEIQK